ncbi:MAG: PqqD family protein [Candidatus Kapabacteria bacterium]|nr:PqqD family protein [Candidatus Kapabacteria bacterium]
MKIKSNLAISESGFVFDPETGDSFTLNFTGKDILNQINQGISLNDIQKNILEKYDVESDSLEMNFYDFISMLKHFNILHENE